MLDKSELGKKSRYISEYSPSLLLPIPRQSKREEIGVPNPIPFQGDDIWNAYELSWLNAKGKPTAAVGTFTIPCSSSHIIESKSFKLYLNSFNQTRFESTEQVIHAIEQDVSNRVNAPVHINVTQLKAIDTLPIGRFSGDCLDELDIETNEYTINPNLLQTEHKIVTEQLYSDLLKSNCLVTDQPDWGSVQISYTGHKIKPDALLKYIISFRNHNEFHEQCVERIFMDIMRQCHPTQLTVLARYTRRGGLDINPWRSTEKDLFINNVRQWRQ